MTRHRSSRPGNDVGRESPNTPWSGSHLSFKPQPRGDSTTTWTLLSGANGVRQEIAVVTGASSGIV